MIGCSLVAAVVALAFGGLTKSSAIGFFPVNIDKRLERACHHDVKKRVPLGHRDIETTAYNVKDPTTGIADGVMMANYDGSAWVKISWTCHINPNNGTVKHSEVQLSASGRRNVF